MASLFDVVNRIVRRKPWRRDPWRVGVIGEDGSHVSLRVADEIERLVAEMRCVL